MIRFNQINLKGITGMKIVVTGDTHLPVKGRNLPTELVSACETADLIIHTGDWHSMEVYEELSTFSQVVGVYGNVDSEQVKTNFPLKQSIQVESFNIGIIHGHGEKKTTEKRVLEAFSNQEMDIIIFGHSHIPMLRYVGKTLLMNPGSPTYKRILPYYSFGILELDHTIRASFIYFS